MYCYIRCCFALHHKMLHTLLHTSVLNICRSTTKTHSMTEALYEANRKGCTMSCSRTITPKSASYNGPSFVFSWCFRKCSILGCLALHQNVWNTLCIGSHSKTKRQSMEHVVVPYGTAKDGPFSNGWIILWSTTNKHRMYHFMMQKHDTKLAS